MSEKEPIVYIVDDDKSVRSALPRLMRSAGIRSMAFESAEQFLAYSRSAALACLVLDVRMPSMSGPELQQRLKSTDPELSIVFITGHFDEESKSLAMAAGALAYLAKPFEDRELLAAIRQAFRDDKGTR